jgi:hypothetical protein
VGLAGTSQNAPEGRAATGAPAATGTFRVFVSSTFHDFKRERAALQQYVFPRLQELCARHGGRFQPVDLRWGVSAEAGLDQRTMDICLDEIARCLRVTPQPNFVVLLGDRYGWRPLPARIEANEFEAILEAAPLEDRALLAWVSEQPADARGWYRRDDNARPPEYVLQPRVLDVPDGAGEAVRAAAQDDEARRWANAEGRLRTALLRAIDHLAWSDDDPRLAKYVSSATEQEIVHGVLRMPQTGAHVFGYFRTIERDGLPLADGLPDDERARKFVDGTSRSGRFEPDAEARAHLEALRRALRGSAGVANVRDYRATWQPRHTAVGDEAARVRDLVEPDGYSESDDGVAVLSGPSTDHLGSLPAGLDDCLLLLDGGDEPHTLCLDAWRDLAGMILPQLGDLQGTGRLDREIESHRSFGAGRIVDFVGRKEPLETIAAYVAGTDPRPLVLVGEPGSGKSALMAKAAESVAEAHPGAAAAVRFIGATPAASDGRSLLDQLCRELTLVYGGDESTIPSGLTELAVEFGRRLALATAGRPLVVFLDALDQLRPTDPARGLAWLPASLPDHVRLIVSTLPGDCEAALRARHPQPIFAALDRMTRGEGDLVLGIWLKRAGRALTDRQRREVLNRFEPAGRPLHLRLAFEEARLWHSYSDAVATALSGDIAGLISSNLFRRLSGQASHGEVMVSHSLGYLAASRYGLSEEELLDVLSADEEVKADVRRRSPNSPRVERLPVVVWSRLYFDLERHLSEHSADGTTLLAFYHGQLREAAVRDYLGADAMAARHAALAAYFRGRSVGADGHWAGGYGRGLSELPYHLAGAGDLEALYGVLTDFSFMEHKAAEVGVVEASGPASTTTRTYAGVFMLQDDYRLAVPLFGSGSAAVRRTPLVVTGVDLGAGLVVSCSWCHTQSPFRESWRGAEIACPSCEGPLLVNEFVVGESMLEMGSVADGSEEERRQ